MRIAKFGYFYIICFLFIFMGVNIMNCAGEKWIVLFDGSSVDAWRGFKLDHFPSGWIVENGILQTIPKSDSTKKVERVDIITKQQFENYILELEWKVSPGGNSGIFYHVSEQEKAIWHAAPEMQVLDDVLHKDGKVPKTSAGSLYDLIAPKDKVLNPVGEFNQVRLIVNGDHVEHWLNGVKIVEYELGSETLTALIAESKFKDKPNFAKLRKGHVGIQHHGEEVWFRNVRILPMEK